MKVKYKPQTKSEFPRYDSISVGTVFRLADPGADDDPNDRFVKIYTNVIKGTTMAIKLQNCCPFDFRNNEPVIIVPGSFVEE